MTDEIAVADGTPTQIANPTRTTVRTIVQAIVGIVVVALPLLNLVLLSLQQYLVERGDVVLPAWVYVTVNVGAIATGFIIGAIARIMAVPGVAAFIESSLPWLAPIKR